MTAPPFSTESLEQRRSDGSTTGQLVGYRLTQNFTVSSKDSPRVEELAGRLSALLNQGVPAARLQALDAATRNAKERAQTIVRDLGGRLGKVRSTRLGVYQVVPRNSTDVSDYGIDDTSSRNKDVVSVVTLTFAVS